MPNSPEAPGPVPTTVCRWGHVDPAALRLLQQLDPNGLFTPCDDPAVVLVYTLNAPNGRELCATHARDVVDAALAVASTPATWALVERVTLAPLPIPYDEPIPFQLVDDDGLTEHDVAEELDELRLAQGYVDVTYRRRTGRTA